MELVTDPCDCRLLDDWQRDFPITERPFRQIANTLGLDEADVLSRLVRMYEAGRISRLGATCAPNTVSASTLAAMAAPQDRIEEIAAIIGAEPGVNHSYLRENEWNLWFVVTGPDRDHVDAAIGRIQSKSGLRVLDLRLVRAFNVDLGFRMSDTCITPPPRPRPACVDAMEPGDRAILQALTEGMPLVSAPYAALAARLDRAAAPVMNRIQALQDAGIISRLGIIVRHRALGWRANAMVVWQLDPEEIETAGPALAAHPGVTLCYQRRSVPGIWPYNLYCMIHARSRTGALETLDAVSAKPAFAGAPHRTLFSSRCFKQTGALISLQRGTAA